MKKSVTALAIAALLCSTAAFAQLYKSVGPDGKVTYSDVPPPTAARVEKKLDAGTGKDGDANLPYELAQAVKVNPVTLYTTKACPACDEGRKMLSARGVPFSEKTVTTGDDIQRLKDAGGDTQLPFLTIGRSMERGFESGAWGASLLAAGYPETSKLPKNYRVAPPEPAAPKAKVPVTTAPSKSDAGAAPTGPSSPSALPQPIGNAPPGFKF
ncbi:MAG: glutaredoxin family protein [Herminiimonas sp.]|nr:glutaredoxin family protein [Herminiimonas sp.]